MTETAKEPEVDFDIDAMLASLVSVRSEVPGGCAHRPGARHRTHGQRRGDRRSRPGADHRLPRDGSRDPVDHRPRGRRRSRPCSGVRPGFGIRARTGPPAAVRAGHGARRERRVRRGRSGHRRGTRRRRCARHRTHHREARVRRLLGVRARRSPVHRPGAPELGGRGAGRSRRPAARRRLASRADRLVERGEGGREHDRTDRPPEADPRGHEALRPPQPAAAAMARIPRPGHRQPPGGGERLRRLSGRPGRGSDRRSGRGGGGGSRSTGSRSCSARCGTSGRPGARSRSPSCGTGSPDPWCWNRSTGTRASSTAPSTDRGARPAPPRCPAARVFSTAARRGPPPGTMRRCRLRGCARR